MTCIFKTESEYLARMALDVVSSLGTPVSFSYKEGWYELWVEQAITNKEAHALNTACRGLELVLKAVFVPPGLGSFRQVEL